MTDIAGRAMQWMMHGETGRSSKAICAHMLGGVDVLSEDYPRDPSDLSRCAKLLERIPEWKPRISEMAKHGAIWKALVARWDELVAALKDEVGLDWSKGRSADKTYALMRSIIDPVEAEDPNWITIGPGIRMRKPQESGSKERPL
jgi:hypothetical protein